MKKNIIKIAALILVAAALCTVFAACGNALSGTYTYTETGEITEGVTVSLTVSMTFDGSKVTVTTKISDQEQSLSGEYSIDGEEITFTFDGDSEEAKAMSGTVAFKKGTNDDGKDYIEIEGIKYIKD